MNHINLKRRFRRGQRIKHKGVLYYIAATSTTSYDEHKALISGNRGGKPAPRLKKKARV